MGWASRRRTKRPEDLAYCLLGIMDIDMPVINGEGRKAFTRLQEALMANGGKQSYLEWKNWGPLHIAARRNDIELMKYLLLNQADPSAKDLGYSTPLHAAADGGSLSAAEYLIGYGVELDARDSDGETALHLAVRQGNSSIARVLLKAGADPSISTASGETAKTLARGHEIENLFDEMLLVDRRRLARKDEGNVQSAPLGITDRQQSISKDHVASVIYYDDGKTLSTEMTVYSLIYENKLALDVLEGFKKPPNRWIHLPMNNVSTYQLRCLDIHLERRAAVKACVLTLGYSSGGSW